ncbi:MAG: hypothetical protein IKK83_07145 [Clostridia bacterium]|nr:hypothetical protein [Clostridia bacterium]MBR6594944.1 hypothetical protein [Clostridia bacterium]
MGGSDAAHNTFFIIISGYERTSATVLLWGGYGRRLGSSILHPFSLTRSVQTGRAFGKTMLHPNGAEYNDNKKRKKSLLLRGEGGPTESVDEV